MSSDDLLTPKQVAAMLFITTTYLSNARSTKLNRAGKLPYIKLGAHVFYRRTDVLAHIARYPDEYTEIQA